MLLIKALNFVLFQVGWFGLVYYHNNLVAGLALLLVLVNCYVSPRKFLAALGITLVIAMIGVLNDWGLTKLDIISFTSQKFAVLPAWLLVLWLLFASTFDSSLQWLVKSHVLLQIVLGGFAGASSYLLAAKLLAFTYHGEVISAYILHFINWSILLPLIICVYNFIRRAKVFN